MVDKPGITSLEQLAEVRRVQAETKRIFSICYSEHFETRSTVKAGELVQAGAIGRVISDDRARAARAQQADAAGLVFRALSRYGGILTDIASHQCEQFLFLDRRGRRGGRGRNRRQLRQSGHAASCRISAR